MKPYKKRIRHKKSVAQVEENLDSEMITGKNAVLEALAAERAMNKILIQETLDKQRIKQVIEQAKINSIPVQLVPKAKLDQLTDTPHQGVLAYVAAYEYADFDEWLIKVQQQQGFKTVLILDGLSDPHNLGSILRTADATGVNGIIIPKRRSVSLTATVARASVGAIEYVPVMRVTNLSQTIDKLKEQGYWVAGTEVQQSQDYRTLDANMNLAIVIGSEGQGMSRLTKEKCDFLIHLPMVGHVQSLNASVAAALIMYEIFTKRQ